nr:zinc-ribbon domain-containing protein [uncultured Lichenicoccus sp.]
MGSIRITCPDCAATYDVPETHARAGRRVRCAGCGTQWLAFDGHPVEASTAAAPGPVEPEALTGSRSIAASLKQHSLPAPPVEADLPDAAPEIADPTDADADDADWADAELPDFGLPVHDPVAHSAVVPPAVVPAPRETRWRAAWAASLLLLLAIGFGGVHWREPIMLGWPPSTRLYSALGAPLGMAHMPRAATADKVAPAAASAISSSPSTIRPPGVSE